MLTALTIAGARQHLLQAEPDAIVLDILLPDGSGVDFCREIRQNTAAPILFLTSVTGVEQALEGLRAGGDDYLNKPFHIGLLLARIEAFWRRDEIRQRVKPAETLRCGPLTLDLVAGAAFLHGEDMLLTLKEYALLLLLVQNEGKTLAKQAIYAKVWVAPGRRQPGALHGGVAPEKSWNPRAKRAPYRPAPGGYRLTIEP